MGPCPTVHHRLGVQIPHADLLSREHRLRAGVTAAQHQRTIDGWRELNVRGVGRVDADQSRVTARRTDEHHHVWSKRALDANLDADLGNRADHLLE